ncbi:PKD domain-containing protein [Corallococcus sp. bb12-1]|uniref:PKD domain-containing protein n=1 Tax=Corallococcus sp. bb12-1 TaxID=2996784 RepID=UPI00226F16D6|nr:PKD domain-containing protein [Corallococcus sp. bb12-1]MCY1044853.1 PKD domain-containing protein [Corallococcus sp. bb12-1]
MSRPVAAFVEAAASPRRAGARTGATGQSQDGCAPRLAGCREGDGPGPAHRYTAKGTYRASLTVTDWTGVQNTDTQVLTVK